MRCIFLEIVNNEMCGHVHTKNDSVFNCLSELLIRCGFETYTEFFGCRRKSFGKFRLYFTIPLCVFTSFWKICRWVCSQFCRNQISLCLKDFVLDICFNNEVWDGQNLGASIIVIDRVWTFAPWARAPPLETTTNRTFCATLLSWHHGWKASKGIIQIRYWK